MKKILSVLCALAFIASFACLGVSADAPAVSFALEAAPVLEGDTTLNVNLVVTLPEGATGYELGLFGLDMSYDSSVLTLAEEPSWEVKGTTQNSEDVSVNPYMHLWVSIKPAEQYKAGSTVAATMIFNLAQPAVAGTEYKIDLAVNAENGVASMASKDGQYKEVVYTAEQIACTGAVAVATVPTVETTTAAPVVTEPEVSEVVTTVAPAGSESEAPVVSSDAKSEAPAASESEAPASTKAPDKATQTGDMMFVVVAVMVVALGAAVVVKKVSVR